MCCMFSSAKRKPGVFLSLLLVPPRRLMAVVSEPLAFGMLALWRSEGFSDEGTAEDEHIRYV